MNKPRWSAALAAALIAVSALAGASPAAAAQPVLAEATAGYSVRDLDWHDSARNRAVPVRLYLPDGASAAHPVPLVVFSHGIGGSRNGYSYLGRYWASQGYASAHLQHVGSDRALWRGNVFELLGRLSAAANEEEAVARVHDLRFALDQLLQGELGTQLDARRIVAAGHSYGANTALLAAGAAVQRNGRALALHDARITAAIVLSAPPFYGEGSPAPILGAVSVPSLHVTTTDDVIRIPGYYSGPDDRVAVFEATGSVRKILAVFAGGSHSIFTDRTGTGGAALNPQIKQATRELSLAFLNSVFNGDEVALRAWPIHFADIVTRYTPRGAP